MWVPVLKFSCALKYGFHTQSLCRKGVVLCRTSNLGRVREEGVLYLSTSGLSHGGLLIRDSTHLDCLSRHDSACLAAVPEADVVLWSLQGNKLWVVGYGSSLREAGRINGMGPWAVGHREKIHAGLMVVFRKKSVIEETCYRDTGLAMRPKRHSLAH